jgi:hypothetical protein
MNPGWITGGNRIQQQLDFIRATACMSKENVKE